jgi:cysteine desulfurase
MQSLKNRIYLDYNATAPLRPEVTALMADIFSIPLNASAIHAHGREGRRLIEAARKQVANLVKVESQSVIFNSGATEGNNTVLKYFASKGSKIAVSAIEHPSVLEAHPQAIRIPVQPNGLLDLTALEIILKSDDKPELVSVMMANNETAAIQDISAIAQITKQYGSNLHCDGVQAAGKIGINLYLSGIDFLTISAHKIGGPQGVGALILGQCGETASLLHGGGQEKSARAGTENVAGIAGFGLAAELANNNLGQFQALAKLRDTLENKLTALRDDLMIFSRGIPRLANTSFFALPDISAETLLIALDIEGISASNGSACSSGTIKQSHVLTAMGIPEHYRAGALRISMGWNTATQDIERFLDVFTKIIKRIST